MAGWGGIVAQGLIGGAVGVAEGIKERDVAAQKQQWEIEREQRLSALRVKEAGEKAQAEVDIASKNAGKVGEAKGVAAEAEWKGGGSRVAAEKAEQEAKTSAARKSAEVRAEEEATTMKIVDGVLHQKQADGSWKPMTTKQKAELTEEQKDELRARAEAERARAGYYKAQGEAAGAKGAGTDKAAPKFIKQKDNEGNEVLVDEKTGWTKEILAPVPGKKGAFRLFGPNDPDVPPSDAKIVMKNLETGETLDPESYNKKFYKAEAERRGLVGTGTKPPAEEKAAPAAAGKFVTGKVYKDKAGNRAKWTGSGWEPL